MTNNHHTVLYIGVTNDLIRRVYEHKMNLIDGFTKKYSCHKNDITSAIAQEKKMKKWKRKYKENLIRQMNPEWKDLYDDLC